MKKLFFLTAIAAVFLLVNSPALAAPQGQNLNASLCNTGGSPIVNITYKVTNDPDSGLFGNWALDNYNKKVQVWDQKDGTFCAVVKYEGQFLTTGPLSPQLGAPLSAGLKGSFEGGYQATFDGTFAPSTNKTNGNIGSFDLSAVTFDWVGTYFTGNTVFNQPYWSWTYHGGKNGTWVNASTGNSGDIAN